MVERLAQGTAGGEGQAVDLCVEHLREELHFADVPLLVGVAQQWLVMDKGIDETDFQGSQPGCYRIYRYRPPGSATHFLENPECNGDRRIVDERNPWHLIAVKRIAKQNVLTIARYQQGRSSLILPMQM